MGKNKLEKFADIAKLSNVFEYPFSKLIKEGASFPHTGLWHERIFGNPNPISIELGCGRGEYAVSLAKQFPDRNFIGIDIKGNRMWTGAMEAANKQLPNIVFLRTQIELLSHFFGENEVDEIWLTFPDPQMKKVNKRLTSVRFLEMYKRILTPNGLLKLKTDSPFLYTFTRAVAEQNKLKICEAYDDIDNAVTEEDPLRSIRTYYEDQWRKRGLSIKFIALNLNTLQADATNPDIEIEPDSYRSFNRARRSNLKLN